MAWMYVTSDMGIDIYAGKFKCGPVSELSLWSIYFYLYQDLVTPWFPSIDSKHLLLPIYCARLSYAKTDSKENLP